MKKHHSPRGVRICKRVPIYLVVFLAIIGTREFLSTGNGPLSRLLARSYNEALMASSKIGLGLALISDETTTEDTSLGKAGKKLGKASHKAYVEAAKVKLYAE